MASNIDVKSVPKRGFWSERPAENWEEALVTGNGIMGAMIEGHPYHDTLILNHALLYLPLYKPLKPVSQGKHLNEIRSLLVEGKYEEASQFVVALSRNEGWGFNKRWTDPFIPAFNITIEMSNDSVINYRRTVDFERGVVEVKWEDRNGKYLRDTFISRSDNVVVTRFISDSVPINCKIGVAERLQKTGWADILGLKSTGISDININVKNDYITFRAVFENQWENLIKGYEGVLFLRNRGGGFRRRRLSDLCTRG